MSPETIGALFAGLVALTGAIATAAARRSERLAREKRELLREVRELREQRRKSDRFIGSCLRVFDLHGLAAPRPPEGLFDDLDVDLGFADTDEPPAHRRTRRADRAAPT